MKKGYLFFSAATDVTGNVLKEKLKIDGGQTEPKGVVDYVISWGAKTKKDIAFAQKVITLNHPNAIRKNRNKFTALEMMKKAGVPVGKFITSDKVIAAVKENSIKLPVIGRTNYHQGGKNFWTCLSKTHIQEAIKNGAQYFQEYVPIVNEYRMHVFNGEVFYASIKTQSADAQKSFVDGHLDKIKATAKKNGQELDDKTIEYTLDKIASRNQHANPILKSHAEGWKFKALGTKTLTTDGVKEMIKAAIAATKALNLDFGAVDCGITEDGKAVILEVNTGPGLEGTCLEKWVEQLLAYIKKLNKAAKPEKTVAKETTAKQTIPAMPRAPALPHAAVQAGSKKDDALKKAELFKQLLLNANDEETDSIMSAASRMFAAEAKGAAAMYNKD